MRPWLEYCLLAEPSFSLILVLQMGGGVNGQSSIYTHTTS